MNGWPSHAHVVFNTAVTPICVDNCDICPILLLYLPATVDTFQPFHFARLKLNRMSKGFPIPRASRVGRTRRCPVVVEASVFSRHGCNPYGKSLFSSVALPHAEGIIDPTNNSRNVSPHEKYRATFLYLLLVPRTISDHIPHRVQILFLP